MKKVRKPKVLHKLRRGKKQESVRTSGVVPRITNETVAEHREQVIGSARKYIYPLQHSKHRVVIVSITLFIAVFVAFFIYCTLALYKFKDSSTFLYKVTQVIPFPVARTGREFVAYENYLFELRHYVHYYQTQGKLNFSDPKNKEQLDQFKKRALDKVINDAYVKKLAKQNNISVNDQEVDDQIEVVRSQNRLGNNDKVFEDVLKDFWGWSVDDFHRSLKQEMLTQKVLSNLDTQTQERAKNALAELKGGADFAVVTKAYSDDVTTKDSGGEYGFAIDRSSKDIPAQVAETLFKLKPGEFSEVINTGYELVIVKNIETNGDKIRAARISFNFKNIEQYLNDLKDQQKARAYIKN